MAHALPDAEIRIGAGGHCPWLNDAEQIAEWVNSFLRARQDRGLHTLS
jgi:hypothetical protein